VKATNINAPTFLFLFRKFGTLYGIIVQITIIMSIIISNTRLKMTGDKVFL
jgi:hypothetical protein